MFKPEELSRQAAGFLKRGARSDSTTGLKGVYVRETKGATIYYARTWRYNNSPTTLGGFSTAAAAAKAYDSHVRENIGSWAYTNFIEGTNKRTKIK